MTGTVKLDAATLDGFAAEFTKHYEAKEYAEAYPYGIVLFDQGRREKSFLHHLASVSVFTNKRTPLLKRLRAWAEQPDADAIAHELIAGLVHHLGDEQENREHALKYAQKNALDHKLEYEPEHVRLRVVVLKTVASGVYNFNASKHSFNIPEGHNNLNGMLAPFINQYSVLVDDLEAAKAAIESLEHVDVIYNAITDPDRCAQALNNAAALCDSFADIPVVNHPRAILETTRDNNIGVDFLLGKDSRGNEGIVIFEMNAAMANRMKTATTPVHIRVASEKIIRRMHHVFCDKAGVPAWNFYLPIEPSP